jgi:hypothetical protein
MRILLILFISAVLLSSCSNEFEPVEVDFFENDTIPLAEKIKKVLEPNYMSNLGFNEEQTLWLQDYYSQHDYKPLWINDSALKSSGEKMKETLSRSIWFGIPEKRLKITIQTREHFVEEEIILTAKLALVLNDLNNGFLNFEEKKFNPESFAAIDYLDSTLAFNKKLSYDKIFLKQGVADSNYQFISTKLYEFCAKYPIDKTSYDIQTIKTDSIQTLLKTTKALISKGYLQESKSKDSLEFKSALKTFQAHNGLKQDAIVGKYTSWALNESTYNKVLRTSLMLEKLRQRKEYPEKCIRINIPEYKLRFYANDSLKRVHNIIVGKTENQTPELVSKVNDIMVYPFWKVPYSIASKEVLPAAKRNSAYFSKNHFKVYRGDHEVNPYKINWKKIKQNSFPYTVIQQPGPENSLGVLKFEFHNNYSVYVHDTPSKSLFRADVRSFSHGCMRCENPIELGKTILDYDSIKMKRNVLTADSLDSLLAIGENYRIKLRDPIPIYVEYNTVYADRDVLIFYLDIYKRDEEYLKIMNE